MANRNNFEALRGRKIMVAGIPEGHRVLNNAILNAYAGMETIDMGPFPGHEELVLRKNEGGTNLLVVTVGSRDEYLRDFKAVDNLLIDGGLMVVLMTPWADEWGRISDFINERNNRVKVLGIPLAENEELPRAVLELIRAR